MKELEWNAHRNWGVGKRKSYVSKGTYKQQHKFDIFLESIKIKHEVMNESY